MSVKEVVGYEMWCDGCKAQYEAEYFTMWSSQSDLLDMVKESDWTTDGTKWHCYDCESLFQCVCCGRPAEGLAGERDNYCQACWDSMALVDPPNPKYPDDRDGVCTMTHEPLVLGMVHERGEDSGVFIIDLIRDLHEPSGQIEPCCQEGHKNMTDALQHGQRLRDKTLA